ncbi:hypothetical protein EON68_01920, partial [archaeon]
MASIQVHASAWRAKEWILAPGDESTGGARCASSFAHRRTASRRSACSNAARRTAADGWEAPAASSSPRRRLAAGSTPALRGRGCSAEGTEMCTPAADAACSAMCGDDGGALFIHGSLYTHARTPRGRVRCDSACARSAPSCVSKRGQELQNARQACAQYFTHRRLPAFVRHAVSPLSSNLLLATTMLGRAAAAARCTLHPARRTASCATVGRRCIASESGSTAASSSAPAAARGSTVDDAEVRKFSQLAGQWWSGVGGAFEGLHSLNRVRVPI